MAKIKIILDKKENEDDVKEAIAKAFVNQHKDKKPKQFQDPVLREIDKKLNENFAEMLENMTRDIEAEIKNGGE